MGVPELRAVTRHSAILPHSTPAATLRLSAGYLIFTTQCRISHSFPCKRPAFSHKHISRSKTKYSLLRTVTVAAYPPRRGDGLSCTGASCTGAGLPPRLEYNDVHAENEIRWPNRCVLFIICRSSRSLGGLDTRDILDGLSPTMMDR